MSATVDSRVVQMNFDNKQFERNISTTISSIEKLNKSMDTANSSKGLSGLTDGIKTGNLDQIVSAVESIQDRFSTFGIVGMEIIKRLTNAGIDMGKKIGNALTGDILGGGKARAMSLEQSSFLLEGILKDSEKVQAVLDNVDGALTGTSYALDEGAKAAAMFTASGIEQGDKMVDALMGVAGAASMTGADFMEIADIFGTIAGQGVATTQQLDRFTFRGLAVTQEWAKALGVSSEEFDKMVKEHKLSAEDFLDFMSKQYGEHAKDANNMFSGALANFHTSLKRMGAMFWESALPQATKIINSAREGLGDIADELKPAAKIFDTFVSRFASFIVDGLSKLKELGAFINIGKGIASILTVIMRVLEAVGTAILNAFNNTTVRTIADFAEKFKDFALSLDSATRGNGLSNFIFLVQMLLENFSRLGSLLSSVARGIKDVFKFMYVTGDAPPILDIINILFSSLLDIAYQVKNAFSQVFSAMDFSNVLTDLLHDIVSVSVKISEFLKTTSIVKDVFVVLFSAIKTGLSILGGFYKIIKSIVSALAGFAPDFSGVTKIISEFANSVSTGASQLQIFDKVSKGITNGAKTIKQAFDKLMGGESIFTKLADAVRGSGNVIRAVFETLADIIGGFIKTIGETVGSFVTLKDALAGIGIINIISSSIGAFKSFGDTGSKLREVFTNLKDVIGGFQDNVLGLPESIKNTFDTITDKLSGLQDQVNAKSILEIGVSLLALAVGMKILSTIDAAGLAQGLGSLTILLGELVGAVALLFKILDGQDAKKLTKNLKALDSISGSMIKFAIAMLVMAKALQMIATLKPQELAVGLIGITVMLGAVLGFSILMSKYGGSVGEETAKSLLVIAVALNIMAKAVETLGNLSVEELTKGLGSIIILLGAIFGFVVGLEKLKANEHGKNLERVAMSMIILGVALNILAAAVSSFGSLNVEELAKGLGSVIILMGAIFGLSVGLEKLGGGGKGMIAAGAGMILIATAIRILTPAVQELGSIPMANLGQGLIGLALGLTAMAIASNFVNLGGAAGILIMAIALSSLTTSIERLGSMDISKIAKGIGAIAAVMLILMGIGALASMFSAATIGLIAFGIALLAVGAGLTAIGIGLTLIGVGLTSLSSGILSTTAVTATALGAFGEILSTIFESIINLIPNLMVALAEGLAEFLASIAELAPGIVESMTTIIHTMIEALNNNVPALVDCGLNLIGKFLESLAANISGITESAVLVIAGFVEGIAAGLPDIIQAAYDLMISFIQGLADGIRNNQEAIRAAILDLGAAMLEAFMGFFGIHSPSTVMKDQGNNVVLGLINGIRQKIKDVAKTVVDGVRGAVTGVAGKAKEFLSKGKDLVSNLISGIKGKAKDVGSKFKDMVSDAVETVKGFASKFVKAGGNLVKGIAQGIKNGAYRVFSAVGKLAKKALDKFKSSLGIDSPSKEFAKLSVHIPGGVAVGIKKGSSVVNKAVDKLSSNALSRFNDSMSNMNFNLNGIEDTNPTITPVLDLSEIAKGSKGIESLLDGNSVKLAYSANNGINASKESAQTAAINNLISKLNERDESPSTSVFNINVDGTENPEEFASRLIRRLKIETRTA